VEVVERIYSLIENKDILLTMTKAVNVWGCHNWWLLEKVNLATNDNDFLKCFVVKKICYPSVSCDHHGGCDFELECKIDTSYLNE
jgi:hypothetical protein